MKLIIQIPCYNEEQTLPKVLADLPRELPGVDAIEVMVIDDGSTDRTVQVARDHGVRHIVSLGSNRGLAAAFITGLREALRLGADIIVNTDGDNQYDAACIKDLIAPVIDGRLDIVVGTRPIDTIGHFSPLKKCLQGLGSRVVRRLSGTCIPDTTSGFRAYSADAAMKLCVFNNYTYTLETIIQAGHMNIRIGHVPVRVNAKLRESRLISSIPRYVGRSAKIILRSYLIYKPLRTFIFLAVAPVLIGLFFILRFVVLFYTGRGAGHVQSLILAGVLLLIGFHLLTLGVLADLISTNRRLLHEALYNQRRMERNQTQPKES